MQNNATCQPSSHNLLWRTSANSFLLLRKLLAFGLCNVTKLLFRHRLDHLLGSTLQAGFLYFAALRCQRSTRSHLLFLGTSWHNLVSLPAMRLVARSFDKESYMFARTRPDGEVSISPSSSTALFSNPPIMQIWEHDICGFPSYHGACNGPALRFDCSRPLRCWLGMPPLRIRKSKFSRGSRSAHRPGRS